MADYLSDFAQTANPKEVKFLYAAKPYVFFGVTKTGSTLNDPSVDLSFSGNDPKGVLTIVDPRPSTGDYIKIDKLKEPRKTNIRKTDSMCGAKQWYFEFDPSQPITGDLIYSDDPDIKQYLRTGGNTINGSNKTITVSNNSTKESTTLLIIRKFLIRKENILETHFYPKVYISPVDEPEANNNIVRTPISIFPAIDAEDNYCYIQYIRLLQNGTNILLSHDEWKAFVRG